VPADIRFTSKGETLYAFCMEKPTGDISITSLGKNSKLATNQIASIKMLGSDIKIKWSQNNEALIIRKPSKLPSWNVPGFKIEFKK
jgi:alpha-L-fucosidase